MKSPDINSKGLLTKAPSANRYENKSTIIDDVGALIARCVKPASKVLDVGCGTGSISEVIKVLSQCKIEGIEPDADRCQIARERGIPVHDGILTQEYLQTNGPYDHIIFADVLEHLPDPSTVIELARTGLKEGGSIIASVPNIAHFFVRTDLLLGKFDYADCGIMDATHLRWFTRKTLLTLFRNSGFEVVAISYTVNIDLPEYSSRLPWRLINKSLKRAIIRPLVRIFPTLFGCQFVVKAVVL